MTQNSSSVRVQEAAFDPGEELNLFRASCGDIGAVASFSGHVRGESGSVATLHLDHYAGFTEKEITKIADRALGRFEVDRVLVIHRFGAMSPGEPIVFVAAAGAHRRGAFEAVDFLMDYLKTSAPFWKRETGPDGEKWIEPRDDDYADKDRWSD